MINRLAAALFILVLAPSPDISLLEKVREIDNSIIVTGGTRTAKRQAELMWNSWHNDVDLYEIYVNRAALDEIIIALRTMSISATESVIKQQMSKGVYISKHLCGKAIDIRSRNLNKKERKKLVDKLNSYDSIEAIQEYKPMHIHIESKEPC